VFSSVINLNNANKKELSSVIEWEAKKLIPLPLEDMVLDWKIIDEEDANKNTKVFLTGSPKKLIKKYVNIFRRTDIALSFLETESFSLIRSLVGEDKSTVMLIQIGASNTDISVIKKGIPILSRSIDAGGLTITKAISNNLNIGLVRAEQFKIDLGINMNGSSSDVIPKTILGALSPVINEIKYLLNLYNNGKLNHDDGGQKVEKIILTGGSSNLPNFVEYLSQTLNMNVIIGDPWSRISYPEELRPILKEAGPGLAIAIGSAIRGIS
jgi:type IV pilus assembly protein PilM